MVCVCVCVCVYACARMRVTMKVIDHLHIIAWVRDGASGDGRSVTCI